MGIFFKRQIFKFWEKNWKFFLNEENFWKYLKEITVLQTDTGRQLIINKVYERTMVKELGKIPL